MRTYTVILLIFITFCSNISFAQIEPFTYDSTWVRDVSDVKDKFKNLSFSGYLQVQYQFAEQKGIASYNGGSFRPNVNNRFMIRRGRLRADYLFKDDEGFRKYYFALQFDGTERGVNIRDFFGRIYENKWNVFVGTVGVFNRPFGYELQNSSSRRESPERGRMSQILMKNERDLGAMVSFQPQALDHPLHFLNIDLGVFNGQGLAAAADYDSYKDVVTRVSVKDISALNNHLLLAGGVSMLSGGIGSASKDAYSTKIVEGHKVMALSVSASNLTRMHPRKYMGADVRMRVPFSNAKGYIEARAEYIQGQQSALANTSVTPTELPADGVYTRNFDGAYLYLIGSFFSHSQFLIKYDWYDPNTDVSDEEINETFGFSEADVRYNTLGIGYVHHLNNQVRIMFYWDSPRNERTLVDGYREDIDDDTFTARVQFRF